MCQFSVHAQCSMEAIRKVKRLEQINMAYLSGYHAWKFSRKIVIDANFCSHKLFYEKSAHAQGVENLKRKTIECDNISMPVIKELDFVYWI